MTNIETVEGPVTLLRNDPHPEARDHLIQAKRKALEGDAAGAAASEPHYRACADDLASAMSIDRTLKQKKIAEEMERSAAWVSTLLKWRKDGYPAGGPFATGNARKQKRNSSVRTEDSGPVQLAAKISRDLTRLQDDLHALTGYLQTNPHPGNLFSEADESILKEIRDLFKQIRIRRREGIPSAAEAEASYQKTLYDQACLFLDSMTDETRQKFFAYIPGEVA